MLQVSPESAGRLLISSSLMDHVYLRKFSIVIQVPLFHKV